MYYLDSPLGRHRAPWTVARRMSDRLFPQAVPGKHHAVWSVPEPTPTLVVHIDRPAELAARTVAHLAARGLR